MRSLFIFSLLCAALIISGCAPASATASTGRPAYGELIYRQGKDKAPACINCHALEGDDFSLGPNMVGFKNRVGAELKSGQTIEQYLHESIVDPNAYLVSGYRNIMYGLYAQDLSEQDINDLIAFILSL